MYRPFDRRFTYYTGKTKGFMCRPRRRIMNHFQSDDSPRDNVGIVIGRAGQAADFTDWNVIYCTDGLSDYNIFRRGGGTLFPFYLYHDIILPLNMDAEDYFEFNERGRRPNLSKAFVVEMEAKLGLPFQTESSAFTGGDSPDWFGS